MKITLIYVGVGVAGFNANRPMGDREGGWIGHGVASVGASAKRAGYQVDLIDMRQLSGWEAFEQRIKSSPSDVYGLSVSAVDHWPALRAILILRRTLPECKIIVGGIHPSIFPQEYDFDAVDCVVQGEGEVSFVELLIAIEKNNPLPKVMRWNKPNLDKIPYVDRGLFDYGRELSCQFTPDQDLPSITMLAGRGCPYHCQYCQPAENAVFGKPFRIRSPENIIDEMHILKQRYGFKSVTFWDDTFTFKTEWVRRFCSLYEQSGIRSKIVACSRADIICRNEGMIERLAEVGVIWLVIGLESGSQRILNFIKKGTTVEQNVMAAKICRLCAFANFSICSISVE